MLRPGGRFVFSINVPEPSWGAVAWGSLPALVWSGKPLRHLKNAWRMMRYGRWLKQEARQGQFHYLPAGDVIPRLKTAGWADVTYRLSYRRQAYIFRAVKTGA